MSFNTKLTNLLKTDPRFVDDEGELILAAVQDRAWQVDRDLVKLLLSDTEIKAKFFEEIEGHWIFNFNTFLDYISQKNFLDNSYTRFKNRIGLTIDGKYLHERGEVALVWPYKDTVLEGGQTNEEEKRKEIFFNEVLAQDEINRLLDPKVLTNFTRYTIQGEEKVTNLHRDEQGVIRENLIIKGNNLLALHTLKAQFREQVKLIYIDPPYNNGIQTFGYNDSFNHSTWLTFMKNRLEVAHELLSSDGSLWVNMDEKEAHYLKVLVDEIFGRENFVTSVIWQKKFAPQNDAKYFSDNHDFILVAAKNKTQWQLNPLIRAEDALARYTNVDNDSRGAWSSGDLTVKTYTAEYDYEIITPSGKSISPPKGSCWRLPKTRFEELVKDNRIWFGKNGDNVPRLKRFLSEVKEGQTPLTIWLHQDVGHNQEAKQELNKILETELFKTPKPERLLKQILSIGSNPGDIVLDFFAGSGTTAAVALKMGRQYITIEQMDYAKSITATRLQKVIGGEQGGISASVAWLGGGNFIYCELLKYNETFMERIQVAQSSEELLKIWQDMATGSFLNWYINPEMPEKAIKDFEALGQGEQGMEKQRQLLAKLLDKNQLYVNLSEINDAQFKVSEADKALNQSFYGEI